LLTAFAFEAYMNHVGPTVLSCWKSLERRMSPWRKLERLCEVLDVKGVCDKDKRPGETIWRLFDFRNKLAHGRTHTIEAEPKRLDADLVDDHFKRRLLTDWEELIKDREFAEGAREDMETIVKAIYDALPEPKDYPFTSGIGTGEASGEKRALQAAEAAIANPLIDDVSMKGARGLPP
jgi:hypothetical protein